MTETMTYAGLQIAYDARVLVPRPWTTLQGTWGAELLATGPDGPVLELCAGAGQIGLLAISAQPRRLVCVDSSPVACEYARLNAASAGLAELVEVRERDLASATEAGERFALVIADPPWVRRADIGRFPDDPPVAIDGGPDGLEVARACVSVAAPHLLPGGSILIQLGTRDQVTALGRELTGWEVTEVRDGERGVVARLSATG